MSQAVDFSFARPSPTALKAADVAGVIRYICADQSKCLDGAELAGYRNRGIPVALVYEDEPMDFANGANAGAAKARIAAPILRNFGFPLPRPVYCAIDGNLPASQYADAWAGIHAFAVALNHPEACYGPRPFLYYLETQHAVDWLWELGSSSFNTGPEPKNKRLQQLVGGPTVDGCAVDYDDVLMEDWGQWPAPSIPKPAPKPQPKPETTVHRDVTVSTNLAGSGTVTEAVRFDTVDAWSVVGGAGPNRPIAVCSQAPNGDTEVTVKSAAPHVSVTVRLAGVA